MNKAVLMIMPVGNSFIFKKDYLTRLFLKRIRELPYATSLVIKQPHDLTVFKNFSPDFMAALMRSIRKSPFCVFLNAVTFVPLNQILTLPGITFYS